MSQRISPFLQAGNFSKVGSLNVSKHSVYIGSNKDVKDEANQGWTTSHCPA